MRPHPFEALAPGARRRLLLVLTAATLVSMVVLRLADAPLRTAAAPQGIVSFEFAATPERAQGMVESWEPRARELAAFSLGFDYLFLLLYSSAIALGCIVAGAALARAGNRLASGARALAWTQWAAAALDAVENAALASVLFGFAGDGAPALAAGCAALKFAGVAAGLAYVVSGAGAAWRSRSVAGQAS